MDAGINIISSNASTLYASALEKIQNICNFKVHDVYNSEAEHSSPEKTLTFYSGSDYHLISVNKDENSNLVFGFDLDENNKMELLQLEKYDQDYIVYTIYFDGDGNNRIIFGDDNEVEESNLDNINQELIEMLDMVNNLSVVNKRKNKPQ